MDTNFKKFNKSSNFFLFRHHFSCFSRFYTSYFSPHAFAYYQEHRDWISNDIYTTQCQNGSYNKQSDDDVQDTAASRLGALHKQFEDCPDSIQNPSKNAPTNKQKAYQQDYS